MGDHHDAARAHDRPLSGPTLRVKALESLLVVYSVRFTARELWGVDASPRDRIYVDLWDDYLDAAP